MRTAAALMLIVVVTSSAFGQTSTSPPSFEIADVHASAPRVGPNLWIAPFRGERYEMRQATMVELISNAYNTSAEKVLGGPSWLEVNRFDVIGRTPKGTSLDTAKAMLQTLLVERFKLTLHKDTRPLLTYVLTVAGKHKLKEAAGTGTAGCQPQPPPPPEPGSFPPQTAVCRGMTMAALAELLPRVANAYVPTSIVDSTGLTGAWDFEITFHNRNVLAQAGNDGISLFDALEKQLGLKLEQKELPSTAIVVDSVNETPIENPPGVAAAFPPPPPPEFEVADVKPSPENAPGPMARIQPTGLLNVSGMPLGMLIGLAWDILPDSGLIEGPKWIDTVKVDVVARAFASVAPTDRPPIEIDTLRLMLRALLVDRFKLKTHYEDRPVSAYTLSASNPKLTRADPASRTRCFEGPAPGAKDPRTANPFNSRLLTCQNITMKAFAARLQEVANGYVRTPVADATGLEGGWNLTVNFAPIGQFNGRGRGGDAPAPPSANGGALAASDPNGALTLPEALSRQLGLKLEMTKRPLPVLVIDHVEEKPTEN